MWRLVKDGDVEAISLLLDEGVDPAAPEECLVSRGLSTLVPPPVISLRFSTVKQHFILQRTTNTWPWYGCLWSGRHTCWRQEAM